MSDATTIVSTEDVEAARLNSSGLRPAVFLSCLGTTNYRELCYAPYAGEPGDPSPTGTRFVQLARLKSLAERGIELDGAHILVTRGASGSRSANWDDHGHESGQGAEKVRLEVSGLESCLRSQGLDAIATDIENGANEQEFWRIFRSIAEIVPENADVYVDLTHGFRTLPVIVLLALEYVEKVKGARILELTYGADRAGDDGLAPTWNLEPFLIIRDWASAVDSFVRYGDTRPLAECAKAPTRDLKKLLRKDMPGELYQLHQALEVFGEAIQKCHSPGVPEAAVKLKSLLLGAAEDSFKHDRLQPLGFLLSKVARELDAFPSPVSTRLDYLRAQYAAADWCVKHRLALQALTFLREGLVTALDVALAERPGFTDRGDDVLGMLARHGTGLPLYEDAAAELDLLLKDPPFSKEAWEALRKEITSLSSLRNKLDHAYNGHDEKAPISEVQFQIQAGRFLQMFRAVVGSLIGRSESLQPVASTAPKFLVLFSHSLTPEQSQEIVTTWGATTTLSPPPEIAKAWSDVDPHTDLPLDIYQAVVQWLDQAAAPGDILLLHGEPGLTYLLVRAAQDRRIIPVYATTKRDSNEVCRPDGTVEKSSLFKHVKFREYPTI